MGLRKEVAKRGLKSLRVKGYRSRIVLRASGVFTLARMLDFFQREYKRLL